MTHEALASEAATRLTTSIFDRLDASRGSVGQMRCGARCSPISTMAPRRDRPVRLVGSVCADRGWRRALTMDLEYRRRVHCSMATFISGSELGHMIALSESRSAPGQIRAAAHQRTTVLAGRIAIMPIHPGSAWQGRRCQVIRSPGRARTGYSGGPRETGALSDIRALTIRGLSGGFCARDRHS